MRVYQIFFILLACALITPISLASSVIPEDIVVSMQERYLKHRAMELTAEARILDARLQEAEEYELLMLPAYELYQIRPELVKHKIFTKDDVIRLIKDVAKAYGFDSPAILLAIARQESHFKINALSPAGAYGLMQLMPGTAKDLGVDRHNPVENVIGGARYFLKMRCKFNGYTTLGLAAYNAGPGNVKNKIIPDNGETKQYVKLVYKYYHAFKRGDYDV